MKYCWVTVLLFCYVFIKDTPEEIVYISRQNGIVFVMSVTVFVSIIAFYEKWLYYGILPALNLFCVYCLLR